MRPQRLTLKLFLTALGLSVLLGAGSTAGAAEEAPRVDCATPNVVDGYMDLYAWNVAGDSVAAIVERSRDGGPWWWRDRIVVGFGSSFADEVPDGSVTEYRIRGVLPDGTLTEPTSCGVIDLKGEIPAPESCTAVVDRFGNVTLYVQQNNQLYSRFVIYRSVDGGPRYWRAQRRAWVFDTYFPDQMNSGTTAQYDAVAVAMNGKRSEPIACGEPIEFTFRSPSTPTCYDQHINSMHPTIVVESAGATEEVIYRSIDGGPQWWQVRRDAHHIANYMDLSTRPGTRYDYYVETIGPTGLRSERVFCFTFELPLDLVTPPSECFVHALGAEDYVSWTSGIRNSSFVVYRFEEDGPHYWRGRVEGSTNFTDSTPDGATKQYEVLAVAPDGRRTERTACARQVPPVD